MGYTVIPSTATEVDNVTIEINEEQKLQIINGGVKVNILDEEVKNIIGSESTESFFQGISSNATGTGTGVINWLDSGTSTYFSTSAIGQYAQLSLGGLKKINEYNYFGRNPQNGDGSFELQYSQDGGTTWTTITTINTRSATWSGWTSFTSVWATDIKMISTAQDTADGSNVSYGMGLRFN